MRRAGFELVNARNESVNRVKTGMHGFIRHPDGRLVYVSQDCSGCAGDRRFLYRSARHDRDWTGGRNSFCDPESLVESVAAMFERAQGEDWEKTF